MTVSLFHSDDYMKSLVLICNLCSVPFLYTFSFISNGQCVYNCYYMVPGLELLFYVKIFKCHHSVTVSLMSLVLFQKYLRCQFSPCLFSYSAKSAAIQQCFSLTTNQRIVLSATIIQRNEQAVCKRASYQRHHR
jgi:hypothetical protein